MNSVISSALLIMYIVAVLSQASYQHEAFHPLRQTVYQPEVWRSDVDNDTGQ